MAVLAVELAGLAEHDAITAVGTAEEIAVDGIHTVHLDHAVGQQVKAIAQIAPEIRSLGQQDQRFRGGLFEQPAVFIGVVRAVGAQDAQVVTAHPAQVGYSNGGIQIRLQAHRIPIGLHVGIIRVASAVDRVVKRIIDRRRAHPLVLCQLLQLALVQLRQGCGVLLLRVGKQDAAQRAAAVGKADHTVFGIGVDRPLLYKALCGQRIQLLQSSLCALVLGHLCIVAASGQCGHSSICLLHLAHICGRKALLHSRLFFRLLCKSRCGQRCERESQSAQCTPKTAEHIVFHSHFLRAYLPPNAARRPFPAGIFLPFSLRGRRSAKELSAAPSL